MNLIPTNLNAKLADAIKHSVAADRSIISARSGFWRLVGFGIVASGIGAAIGLGFFGLSYVKQNSDSGDLLVSALSDALARVQLTATAEGVVDIQPSEISLAKDQTISIDPTSRLLLDPSAKVEANGELLVQAPSVSLPSSRSQNQKPSVPVITNFTVFKSLPFEKGTVVTGWVFLTSVQRLPTNQYCYYTESSEISGAEAVVDVGQDQKPEASTKLNANFDLAAAFGKCVWFQSQQP